MTDIGQSGQSLNVLIHLVLLNEEFPGFFITLCILQCFRKIRDLLLESFKIRSFIFHFRKFHDLSPFFILCVSFTHDSIISRN